MPLSPLTIGGTRGAAGQRAANIQQHAADAAEILTLNSETGTSKSSHQVNPVYEGLVCPYGFRRSAFGLKRGAPDEGTTSMRHDSRAATAARGEAAVREEEGPAAAADTASAPAAGLSAITPATAAVFASAIFLRTGVYASVTAAEQATISLSSRGSSHAAATSVER